jgi:hypothetical protein
VASAAAQTFQAEAVGVMPSGSMYKVVIHKASGSEQPKLETHPVPKPRDREVLIRTEAVGVSYADICVRWGVYEPARRFGGCRSRQDLNIQAGWKTLAARSSM